MTVHGTYAVSPLAAPGAVGRRARDAFIQLDGVISVSAFTKGYMHRAAPSLFNAADLERKIRIIHNGVDLSRAGRHAPGEAGIKRIIGVGAVKARKGYKEAIDALAIVRQTSAVHVAYDIIGSLEEDPQYVARLRAHIHDLGLSQCVRLRGIVTEMELREAYASADLFLLLSLHEGFSVEGFGLVFLEANSWGVPVIGPTTGGCPEAISDGVSGYVCDPHDARSAAEHMRAILERRSIDPETCLRWAQAHSSDVMAAAIAEYYRTL